MTAASSMSHSRARQTLRHRAAPRGVDRLALQLGLALVAWGRRSANRSELSWEEAHIQHEANRLRATLLEERVLVPTPR
jgi:hypothetical protein